MKLSTIIFAGFAVSMTAACSHAVDTANAPSFGRSVATMHEAQTIHEAAVPGAPEGSGAGAAAAIDRYKNGATTPLLPSSTSLSNPGQ